MQVSVDCMSKALEFTQTMKLKPPKCRTAAWKNPGAKELKTRTMSSYSCYDPKVTVDGRPIPFVGDDPDAWFKYLGRLIQLDLKDDRIRAAVEKKLRSWLNLVDQTDLNGVQKTWIANNFICAKLSWSLLIYDFPETLVNAWQSLMTKFYKAWLKLPRPADSSVLYRPTHAFGLNLCDLRLRLRHLQMVKWHILKTSGDEVARLVHANRLDRDRQGHIGTGRESSPCLELEKLEQDLHIRIMIGNAQTARRGLGAPVRRARVSFSRILSSAHQRQQLADLIEQHHHERIVASKQHYEMQNAWLRWMELRMQGDLDWNKLLYHYSEKLVQFVLKAQLNVLPTLDNLKRWGISTSGKCGLCGKPFPTLCHILANCEAVLAEEQALGVSENRYKWRHNCVLRTLAEAIKAKLTWVNSLPPVPNAADPLLRPVTFVKAGAAPSTLRAASDKVRSDRHLGLLADARDWICDFDLPEFHLPPRPSFGLPADVGATSNRIDSFILSRQTRSFIAGPELTVPMEENLDNQHSIKTKRYGDMATHLLGGWRLSGLLCLEMGCRGVDPPSFRAVLRQLAFSPKEVSQLRDACAYVARYCSYLIWLNRYKRDFFCPRVYWSDGRIKMDNRSVLDAADVERSAL